MEFVALVGGVDVKRPKTDILLEPRGRPLFDPPLAGTRVLATNPYELNSENDKKHGFCYNLFNITSRFLECINCKRFQVLFS